MVESLCEHSDIRKFDGIRCCLSCGEAVFETSSPTARIYTNDATASYQYTKLNYKLGREIRLVLILPGSSEDALRCEIVHVNLDDDPVYDAVSYTWATEGGDASPCMTVRCEAGGFIPVTANCYAVLLQLRRSGGIRRLWIDAICIDQMNVNERNHQVGFMDQIYSNARSVRICIQDSSLTASLRDYNRLFSWLRCRRPENYAGIQTSLCSDLRHLLSLRYFRRVWVIQEVALAQEVCLHVNNNALLLDSAVMDRMESFRKQNRLRIPSALKWSTCRTIEAGIVACLQAAMECNATDPRDEVYAVLSLMEPQARSLIPVDYSLDLDVVWSNAIAAIIITRGNLDILSHVGVYQHRSVLSTRVRRSSMNRVDIAGYLEKVAFSNSHHLTLPYSKGHRATPWRRQLVMPSNHSDISQQSATFSIIGPPVNLNSMLPRFRVRAHYVDRIDVPMVVGVSLKKRKRGKDYGDDAVYYDWDQKPLDRIRSYSVRSLVAFFKADVDNVSTTDPHKPSHGTSGFHPGTATSESERREALILNDPGIEDTDLSEFIRICQISRKGRPLFTSHFSVGFPGISSEEWTIRRGDEIFAIDGARTPFILRKSEHIADHYEIIDECYLWAALELDCWNPGTRKGRWGPGVERPTTTQTRMINIC